MNRARAPRTRDSDRRGSDQQRAAGQPEDRYAATSRGTDGYGASARTQRGRLCLADRTGPVRRLNQVIYDQGLIDPRLAEMGTTVVGAWVTQHIASVAHVGDSRAYLFHENHLEQLTQDHSLVEAEVRAGLMDREQSRQADHQNVLLKVLGGAPDVDVLWRRFMPVGGALWPGLSRRPSH